MKYINKINGYINGFDNHDLFKGKLLLDDDGWLEGIIGPWDKDSKDEKKLFLDIFTKKK